MRSSQTAPAGESLTLFSSSLADRLSPAAVPGAAVLDRRVPGRLLNFAWHRLGWPPVEQLATGTFDVVQAAHPLLIPTEHAAQVVTIHDLDFLDHPERTHAEIRRDYPALAEAHARRADHIVTISRHTAAEIARRFQIAPEKISVCSPGAPAWTPPVVRACSMAPLLFLGTLDRPQESRDPARRVRAAVGAASNRAAAGSGRRHR